MDVSYTDHRYRAAPTMDVDDVWLDVNDFAGLRLKAQTFPGRNGVVYLMMRGSLGWQLVDRTGSSGTVSASQRAWAGRWYPANNENFKVKADQSSAFWYTMHPSWYASFLLSFMASSLPFSTPKLLYIIRIQAFRF